MQSKQNEAILDVDFMLDACNFSSFGIEVNNDATQVSPAHLAPRPAPCKNSSGL
jgi:hypothetical protein